MLLSSTNRSCEDVPNFLLFIPLPGSVWELYLKHLVVVEDFPRLSEHCPDVGLGTVDHIQDWLLILLQVMKEKGTGSYQPKLLLQVTKGIMTGALQYKLLLEQEVMWNNTNITLWLPEWFYTGYFSVAITCGEGGGHNSYDKPSWKSKVNWNGIKSGAAWVQVYISIGYRTPLCISIWRLVLGCRWASLPSLQIGLNSKRQYNLSAEERSAQYCLV